MSYRSSYTSWKSSLSSNYKPAASSTYSSRDDVGSTARYSSLASPSSYRPSFSGGTYRLKRDTPIVPASTYVSRYTAGSTAVIPKIDTSSCSDSSGSKTSQLKRYGSTSSNLGKYSREPSPAALEHTTRIKSRDPSPATRSLRGKSRDPSPALDAKSKLGYGSASSSSYRMSVPKTATTNTYGSRYVSSSTSSRPSVSTASASASASASISYLSASDFKARSLSKAKEEALRKSNEKELDPDKAENVETPATKSRTSSPEESTTDSETEEEDGDQDETFVSVSVCTRATSPTPPGTATTVHRTRRIDIAKTIEKTIQRSTRKKKTLEKEIQSDRLDDSTRYSRFGISSRVSSASYSPHTERYTASGLRYSNSPISTSSKSSSLATSSTESKKEDSTTAKSTRSPIATKSKLSPPKSVRLNSRQSSVENLSAHKPPAPPKAESPTKSSASSSSTTSKLPNKDFRKSALNVGPTDRPRKSRTPSTGTDSDLNTVEALNGALQAIQRLERSPSAGSEVSNTSNRSIRRTGTESKLRQRCHNKPPAVMSPKSPLSRNNSTTNIKTKPGTSSATQTSSSSAGTTASSAGTTTSSSSGTESCTENKKTNKKIIKKKIIKDVASTTTTSSSTSSPTTTTTTTTTNSIADTQSIKSHNENIFSQQPPAAKAAVSAANKNNRTDSSPSRSTPKSLSDKDPIRRLKKLSSVSNFFATQQQECANSDEQIYLESSENSSGNDLDKSETKKNSISLTSANETNTTSTPAAVKTKNSSKKSIDELQTNAKSKTTKSNSTSTSVSSSKSNRKSKSSTKSHTNKKSSSTTTSTSYCPQDTTTASESSRMPTELLTESLTAYTSTNPTTSSTSGTDQEESSWWQDTSRQIDTASALDFNLKDETRFKIRHIDSGETAWWLRNDDDDTLADDDLKTLNQEEEEEDVDDLEDDEDEDATDQLKSLTSTSSANVAAVNNDSSTGCWITETNDGNSNENDYETSCRKSRSSIDLDKTNVYYVEEAPVEDKPFPKSRITPETDWWIEEPKNEASEVSKNQSVNSEKSNESSCDKSSKQNGSIQLKICRVESGEKPWWLQEEQPLSQPIENEEITVEATFCLPRKSKEKSDTNSSSNSETKNWWMSGPTKKLFNIKKVESGEKAWWQEESNETTAVKENKPKTFMRNDSQEAEWWTEEASPQTLVSQQQNQLNGYQQETEDEEPELQQYHHSAPYNANMIDSNAELSNSFNFEYSERPPPLGQCASPVQQEEPQLSQQLQAQSPQRHHCKSPYENIPMTKVQTAVQQQQQQQQQQQTTILDAPTNFMAGGPIYQQQDIYLNQSSQNQLQPQQQTQYFPHQRQQNYLKQPPPPPSSHYNNNDLRSRNAQQFISRHQNIDELLGGSCRPISPLYYDTGNFQTILPPPPPPPPPHHHHQQQRQCNNELVEEITPDQVRIHDSSAQMPYIKRMERDDWPRDSLAAKPTTSPRFEQRMRKDYLAIF